MEIKKHTSEHLVIEHGSWLMRMVPLVIGGAGLLLILGTMKEYGVQSWYRGTYLMGGLSVALGLLFYVAVPESFKTSLVRTANRMTVSAKRGIRMVYYEHYPLSSIKSVRIEQRTVPNKKGNQEVRFRLAIQIMDEWVPVVPKLVKNVSELEPVARQLQAFLLAESEEETDLAT